MRAMRALGRKGRHAVPITSITLASAITAFADDQRSLGRSEKTVNTRLWAMRVLLKACPEGRQVNEITMDEVSTAFRWYADPAKAGSYNQLFQTFGAFFKFATLRRYISKTHAAELMEGRTRHKYRRQERYVMPRERLRECIEAAWDRHPRDGIAVSTGVYLLARESELSKIQLGGIHLDKMEIRSWREKQDEWFTWGICPPHAADLERYLDWMAAKTGCESAEAMMADHPDWYLCCQLVNAHPDDTEERGIDPTRRLIRVTPIVKHALDAMGIVVPRGHGKCSRNKGTGVHTLRVSGGIAELETALEAGEDESSTVLRIQQRFGHKETSMTWNYLGRDRAHARAVDYYKSNDPYRRDETDAPDAPEGGNVVKVDFSAQRERKAFKARL